jgi:hypothetical protein
MTHVIVPHAPAGRAEWLRSPTHDLAMAFLWVPFALAAHAVAGDPGRLRWLVSATLLFSFAHQPLTLWLVYGDAAQRRAHRSFFAWAPVVATVAVGIGSSLRPEVVALVAGAWNVAHTLRQRYGLCRLYGRMSGVDCASDNRLLWTWLSAAVVVALTRVDLAGTARDVGLGRRNRTAVEMLGSAHAVAAILLPVAIGVAVVVTAAWARNELRRSTHSTARLVYLASTLILLVVLAVDPVTGLVAYVGAHAAEYLLVVRWRIGRAAGRATPGDAVGALARRIGSSGTIGLYAAVVAALIVGMRVAAGSRFALTIVLTLGALHLLYDGVIWHSPRPSPGVTPSGPVSSVEGGSS